MKSKAIQNKTKLAIKLALVACLMFGFGFLLVPLYDIICDVTGLNGKTGVISEERVAQNNLTLDKRQERPVTIEVIAHVDPAMNWHFCLLYTSPSPRDRQKSRMPSSA